MNEIVDLVAVLPWWTRIVIGVLIGVIAWLLIDGRLRNVVLGFVAGGTLASLFLGHEEAETTADVEGSSEQPAPDTTVDELDDAIDMEVEDAKPEPMDPSAYPDDDPVVVDELSEWSDDV